MTYTYLFWQDTTSRTLGEKVAEAVTHFKQKLGRAPLFIGVHPSLLNDQAVMDGIIVKPASGIFSRAHFHLVVEEGNDGA